VLPALRLVRERQLGQARLLPGWARPEFLELVSKFPTTMPAELVGKIIMSEVY
jgi:hypothetical protein